MLMTVAKRGGSDASRDATEPDQEALLDEALEATFPASDPIALAIEPIPPARPPKRSTRARGTADTNARKTLKAKRA